MIEYFVSQNPDSRIIARAVKALQEEELIAFPTDTNWVLAANPDKKEAVKKLYRIKGMNEEKHLSLLCSSISMASRYAIINDTVFRQIKTKIPGSFTFIFEPTPNLPKAIKEYKKKKEIGIRICLSPLCQALLEQFGGPLLITSLSKEMLDTELSPEAVYGLIVEEALSPTLSLVLDPGESEINGPSTVVSFAADNVALILREGKGLW